MPSGPDRPPTAAADPTDPAGLADLQARLDRLAARRAPAAPGAPPRRRRHAAAGSRLVALGLTLGSTGALSALLASSDAARGVAVAPARVVGTTTAEGTGAASAPAGGSVDGAAYRNRWGTVQVRATFSADGTLVGVDALQTPGGRGRSVEINDGAVPRLETEALAVQSARIDTVSGATYTSTDYRRSLQSAIDAARAAGLTGLA